MSLKNKIVLVTGASSVTGIGAACAEQFAALGANLIITGRRKQHLEILAERLRDKFQVKVFSMPLDITKQEAVVSSLQHLPEDWQGIDILVNNAGLALDTLPMQEGNMAHWDIVIQTNINGLLYMTHTVLQGMVARRAGHIINISSIAGHECYPAGNVYSATKHAVRALSKSLRLDLLGTGIRVSDIAPGAVNTEFSTVRWQSKEKADKFYEDFTPLLATDIADAVIYCATRPQHVSVAEMVIYPTDQASANHLNRHTKAVKGMFD